MSTVFAQGIYQRMQIVKIQVSKTEPFDVSFLQDFQHDGFEIFLKKPLVEPQRNGTVLKPVIKNGAFSLRGRTIVANFLLWVFRQFARIQFDVDVPQQFVGQ